MHEGHRQRLLAKLENGELLFEHELLEILLFNAVPRKDMNGTAHLLLSRFASIKEVLNASVDELLEVSGVGKNVAMYLNVIGKVLNNAGGSNSFATIRNTENFIKFAKSRLMGKNNEVMEFYLMDKNGRVKRIASYTTEEADKVNIDPEGVLKLLTVSKPFGLYLAHNHVNVPTQPSAADDVLTNQVQFICSISNVNFYDHCIINSSGESYSYFLHDRMEEIKKEFNVATVFRNGKQT